MFPYSFPHLVVAWAILFGVIHSIITDKNFEILAIGQGLIFVILFIFLAKMYYKETPKTIKEKTLVISYNLGVLPILFANIYALEFIFNTGEYRNSIMIYLLPIIYSPIIFVISGLFVYLILWQLNKKSNKYEETNNLP